MLAERCGDDHAVRFQACILRGRRLATITTLRPMSDLGSVSLGNSSEDLPLLVAQVDLKAKQLVGLSGMRSATIICATRNSTLAKSSMLIFGIAGAAGAVSGASAEDATGC